MLVGIGQRISGGLSDTRAGETCLMKRHTHKTFDTDKIGEKEDFHGYGKAFSVFIISKSALIRVKGLDVPAACFIMAGTWRRPR
jgi:hypothetical protein